MISDRDVAAEELRYLLQPVQHILDHPKMTNLFINGPGKATYNVGEGKKAIDLPFTYDDLEAIAIFAAAMNRKEVNKRNPVAEGLFPPNSRVHIIIPPAVPEGTISLSCRKHHQGTVTFDSLEAGGVFRKAKAAVREADFPLKRDMLQAYVAGNWRTFCSLTVQARLNVMLVGRGNSGKTHNLRGWLDEIDSQVRVALIEDSNEVIDLRLPDVLSLLFSRDGQGVANVTPGQLVEAALRMGVECIVLQEVRDALTAMAAKNILDSGHWLLSTTHAEDPEHAFQRIAGLVKEHPTGAMLDEAALLQSLRKNIQVVVYYGMQLDGSRCIEQVYWEPGQRALAQEAAD